MVKLLELYQQIREGMYDSLVTSISRDIVNEFKNILIQIINLRQSKSLLNGPYMMVQKKSLILL
jgi:hypothetical protein